MRGCVGVLLGWGRVGIWFGTWPFVVHCIFLQATLP